MNMVHICTSQPLVSGGGQLRAVFVWENKKSLMPSLVGVYQRIWKAKPGRYSQHLCTVAKRQKPLMRPPQLNAYHKYDSALNRKRSYHLLQTG